jgi:2-oxoglutarate/malate translocator
MGSSHFSPEIRREAAAKIQALGLMSHSEIALCLIYAIALLLWYTSDLHGIEAAWVALLGLSAMLLTRVLSWEDILEQRGTWDVLI